MKNGLLKLERDDGDSTEAWLANGQSQRWPSESRASAHNVAIHAAGYSASARDRTDVVADSALQEGVAMPDSSLTELAIHPRSRTVIDKPVFPESQRGWSHLPMKNGFLQLEHDDGDSTEAWLANSQCESWPSESPIRAHNEVVQQAGYSASARNRSDVIADSALQEGDMLPLLNELTNPPSSGTASNGYTLDSTATTRQACPVCGQMHAKAVRPGKSMRSHIKRTILEAATIQDGTQRLHRYTEIAAQHGSYACALVMSQGLL
eukprot:TRINITY_DN4946_c0_g1_i4.p1 TRINITY_DN4946_c0_g1~~TRINITY_DN4946_c0_g1_i4.p1  ORF type:complete len:264 (-),score=34.91 TRINITY_DN4946_c0_g1_i4:258-1049(-)